MTAPQPAPDAWLLAAAQRWRYSLIPCGLDKRPLIPSWTEYQRRHATPEELAGWSVDLRPPAWAVVTGAVSGLVIVDFDGEAGKETMRRLGVSPHVQTGSGGYHLYVQHPGWKVKTVNAKSKRELGELYPGLDVRADGGYALCFGRNASGFYEHLRDLAPDPADVLPAEARAYLGLSEPPAEATTPPPPAPRSSPAGPSANTDEFLQRKMQEYLSRAGSEGRNQCGFLFAAQLRDAGLGESEAWAWMLSYQRQAPPTNTKGQPEPYTEAEARRTLDQAFKSPRREPARNPTKPTWQPRPPATVEERAHQAPPPADADEPPPFARPAGRPRERKPHECLRTDLGNAERLVLRFGKILRFCHPLKKWYVYDGRRWAPDDTAAAARLALETIRLIFAEAKDAEDAEQAKAISAWAFQSQSAGKIAACLDLAKKFQQIAITPEQLDADGLKLNCQNGTLNLTTGRLEPHRKEDLITRLSPVSFDPEAVAPTWADFIGSITCQRPQLGEFLRLAIGYSLTGLVSEKCLFVAWGSGNNGKTTFLEVIRHILGDYAGQINIESLMATRRAGGAEATPDLADLRGRRFVTTSEADDGARLNEARVKHLTGMGQITARNLYAEFFTFAPTFKLWMDTNYRPTVRGTDKGIWSRLKTIPFELQLAESQLDRALRGKLEREAAAILAWAVDGCLDWQRAQLPAVAEIEAATHQYRLAMDSLGQFLEECTTEAEDAQQPARDLYRAYAAWARGAGEMPLSERRFAESLADRGQPKTRTAAGQVYRGFRLSVSVSDSGEIRPLLSV